jgi:truncated hemoglobin YjbI
MEELTVYDKIGGAEKFVEISTKFYKQVIIHETL